MTSKLFKDSLLVLALCCTTFFLAGQCSLDIDIPDDITICEPMDVNLTAIVSPTPLNVIWEGSNGFTSSDPNTNIFVSETTEFTLSAFISTNTNLVVNGDFELGNTGFTSGYLLGTDWCTFPQGPLWCEGMYVIDDDPSDTHPNFTACDDHTSGFGNMLVANGSGTFTNVWCQDISVNPNTDYLFSAWATTVLSESPPILQFTINGNAIGANFNVNNNSCDWQNFTASWNSAGNTNATICVQNQNVALSGNDFALDDIEFIEVCRQQESFTVTVSSIPGELESSYTINCNSPEATLTITPSSPNYAYQWEASFGGIINGPTNTSTAFGISPGLYNVTITDNAGCTRSLSTTVNGGTTLPQTTVLGDFEIDCGEDEVTVFSSNNNMNLIFDWGGTNSTSPTATYNTPGLYTLTITDENGCSSETTFGITQVSADLDYSLTVDGLLNCIGDSTTIRFETLEEVEVEWTDLAGNVVGDQDSVTVNDVGIYIIEITLSNGCMRLDTAQINSQASQLLYTLGESPVITCATTQVELEISVDSPISNGSD